jgi:hypothetical protein
MSEIVSYSQITVQEDTGARVTYTAGQNGITRIERAVPTLMFVVHFDDGTTKIHRSQEIVDLDYTPENRKRYGLAPRRNS